MNAAGTFRKGAPMAFTVSSLLEQHIFENMHLLAGQRGLSREIHWINIMEILDSPDSVAPHELLFTTGYGLQNDALHRNLIPRLAKRGVSGLVIQTGYYVDDIPAFLLGQADSCDFPIITIPKSITFSNILHTMMQVLNSTERQSWNDSHLQAAEVFVRETLAKDSAGLFGEPAELKKSADRRAARLMLLEPVNGQYLSEDRWNSSLSQISSYLQSCSLCFHSKALARHRHIFFLSVPEKESHTLIYGLNIRLTLLSEQSGAACYAGSVEVSDTDDSSVSVRRAAEAIDALRSIHAKRGVCPFEQIKFILLLGHMHQFDHSAVLDNYQLQQLLDYDRRNGTNYVQTLRVYLSNNCSITQSAGYLFIHRHTLLKRLEKIREISDLNLEDWYTRVYMSINLLFHDYFIY